MAVPSVGEIFQGSIDESLKKLVQPAAVVPATVLVGLNFVLIYPRLLAAKLPMATAFDGLDDAWKGIVLTVVILVVGYVILSLSGSTMRLATGELIADTAIGRALIWLQVRRIKAVTKHARDTQRIRAEDARLPPPDQATPTRLGTVLAGANWSIYQRYGFDMAAVWAHLQAVLAKDQETFAASLDDEYTGLQVLVNLAAVTIILGTEAAFVSLVARDGAMALAFLISVPLAYGLYRAACARARGYTDLVEVAVDLYRSMVGDKLGIKADPDDPSKEKAAWVSLRSLLLWDERVADPPDPMSTLAVTTTTTDDVTITALPVRLPGVGMPRPSADTPPTSSVAAYWVEEYAYLWSRKATDECCNDVTESQLVLAAGKDWVWDADAPPAVTIGGATATAVVLKGGLAGDSLLISTGLSPSSSKDVRFSYERKRVELKILKNRLPESRVKARFETVPELGAESIKFLVHRADGAPLFVKISFTATWMSETVLRMKLAGNDLTPTFADGVWTATATLDAIDNVLVVYLPQGELKTAKAPAIIDSWVAEDP
jgi:hypothetical protein